MHQPERTGARRQLIDRHRSAFAAFEPFAMEDAAMLAIRLAAAPRVWITLVL